MFSYSAVQLAYFFQHLQQNYPELPSQIFSSCFPTDLCIPARKFSPEWRNGSTRSQFVFSDQRHKDEFCNPSITEGNIKVTSA